MALSNSEKAQIRDAESADMPSLIEMGRAFWATIPHFDAPYDDESAEKTFQMTMDQGLLLVLTIDGQPKGVIGGLMSPMIVNYGVVMGNELIFWIEPECRGHGRMLLGAMERQAAAAGITYWIMTAFDSMPEPARSIYRAMGYGPTEISFVKRLN